MSLHRPIGIKRHAHHVELATVFQEGVEVPVVDEWLMTTIQMHDDDGLGEDFFHGIVASTDETSILLRFGLDVSHGVSDDGMSQ